MNARTILVLLSLFFSFSILAQNLSQNIRGKVLDKDSNQPLPGVSVYIPGTNPVIGTQSNESGDFILKNVPLGRVDIKASFIGYKDQTVSNLELVSGKESFVTIPLEESVTTLQDVTVTGYKNKTLALNEMSSISARTFSVEETGRYAGSRNDVSRMASNYAGVSNGDDSRNDIIIRGNSPIGLLWRLDELEIPSPNHFSTVGASGGPVSMLNYNVIANSDFMTGAFPAEFGNATSGVFDIKLREGNSNKREYMVQAGALGTEMMAEGPFSKNYKGSYLMNYRFSTTSILTAMGINFGYSGEADYQDMAYKLNFPLSDRVNLSFFGMGGKSLYKALYKNKKETDFSPDSYLNTNSHFYSATGAFAGALNFRLSENSYIKSVFGFSGIREEGKEDSVALDFSNLYPSYRTDNYQYKLSSHTYLKAKLSARNKIKIGFIADQYSYKMNTKVRKREIGILQTRNQGEGDALLLQAYSQWNHAFSDFLTMNTGLHYQYLELNKDQVLEPRWGLKWSFTKGQSLSFGYGLHSQIQILPMYMIATRIDENVYNTNKSLKFNKSSQFVLGYSLMLSANTALKAETYYQYLYDIPVTMAQVPSSFSAVNEGMSYIMTDRDSLVNAGTGRNYGIELTLERFFSKGYYYLLTTSLFDSKYKGSDGVFRNTAFNGKYVFNALVGKEFKINAKSKFLIDLKLTTAGGKRYTPINAEASKAAGYEIRVDEKAFSEQFKNYFRTDLKLTYRINTLGAGHEFFINIDNLFNTKNVFSQVYDVDKNQLSYIYQLGIFPTFQYKIYF